MFGFLAQLLSWCYGIVPNYAVAIGFFTLVVMLAVTPFTIKGMRSSAEMTRLQPEMKRIQDQYKNDKLKQNEEVQALFKEHGVSPLGGCLPMVLPLPIFFIIFRLLRGLNGRHNGTFAPLVRVLRHQTTGPSGYVAPHYLSYKSTLTQHLIGSNGVMKSFGMDLSATARQHHSSPAAAVPFYVLIAIMTAATYWQQRQVTKRTPPSAQNQQTKLMMQFFPAFYALISLNIPASVVFYLLISSLFRMVQMGLSYRYDPIMAMPAQPPGPRPADGKVIPAASRPRPAAAGGSGRAVGKAAVASSNGRNGGGGRTTTPTRTDAPRTDTPKADAPRKGGFLSSLREAAAQAREQQPEPRSTSGSRSSRAGSAGASIDRPRRERPASSPPPSPPEADSVSPELGPPELGAPEPAPPPTTSASAPSDAPRSSPLSVRPSGRFTPPGGGGKRAKKRG